MKKSIKAVCVAVALLTALGAATGCSCNGSMDGAVKLTEVQGAGGKRMSGGDFLNGRKVQKGQVLGC